MVSPVQSISTSQLKRRNIILKIGVKTDQNNYNVLVLFVRDLTIFFSVKIISCSVLVVWYAVVLDFEDSLVSQDELVL